MPILIKGSGGKKAKLQSKTVSPSISQQIVTPDSAYDGLNKVAVNAMKLQSKSVSPSTSAKAVYPDSSYDGLSSVTVNAAPTETKKITDNGTYTPTGDNVGFGSVEVATTMGIFGRAINNTSGYYNALTFDLTGSNGDSNWYQNSNIELPDRDPDYIMLYMVPWTVMNSGYTITNSDSSTNNMGIIYGEFFHPNSSSTEWNFRGRNPKEYILRGNDYITVSYDKTAKKVSLLLAPAPHDGDSGFLNWQGNENASAVYVAGLFWKN